MSHVPLTELGRPPHQRMQLIDPPPPPPGRGRGRGGGRGAGRGGGRHGPQQHAGNPPPQAGNGNRLERDILDGCMWHASCQAAAPPLPGLVPLTFSGLQQYVDTFAPILCEEARQGVKNSYQEASQQRRGFAVAVVGLQPTGNGWYSATLTAQQQEASAQMHRLKDGALLVLQLAGPGGGPPDAAAGMDNGPPNKRQRGNGAQAGGAGAGAAARRGSSAGPDGGAVGAQGTASIVTVRVQRRGSQPLVAGGMVVTLHPACPAHANSPIGQAACTAVLQLLEAAASTWWVTPAGNLITAMREVGTLLRLEDKLPLLPQLLHPDTRLRAGPEEVLAALPVELSSSGRFLEYLHTQFDGPQVEAIHWAASHLLTPAEKAAAAAAAEGGDGPQGAAGSSGGCPKVHVPFTLIQGPPGTGKTHTVLGVLNAWHLTEFQRFYTSLDKLFRQECWLRMGAPLDVQYLMSEGFLRCLAPRPRILVCAPSNAATDELLQRILSGCFRDVTGSQYYPKVTRVGSEEALGEEVKQVWTEHQAGALLALTAQQFGLEEARLRQALHGITIALTQNWVALGQTHPQDDVECQQLVNTLVRAFDDLQQTTAALDRLEMVSRFIHQPPKDLDLAQQSWAHHQANPQGAATRAAALGRPVVTCLAQLYSVAYSLAPRSLCDRLEGSFVDQAELVFTTLSSSARDVFAKLQRPFELVLIDEAAQAEEVAALQPLVHGAAGVVLVGDPQQLPATVFSSEAREVQFERSLFERLQQAGCPVKLLRVQYRMHPAIRTFPSAHFYQNQLEDAPSVLARAPNPFTTSTNLLQPYTVFEVAGGRERFGARQKSPDNEAEGRLALALYQQLLRVLEERAAEAKRQGLAPPDPVKVGIITPYKGQRAFITRLFEQALGPAAARAVRIETVDSFQGKQMDVIMLSCVRAGGGGSGGWGAVKGGGLRAAKLPGVGFLADTRRMNVAITRARLALWVLGHHATLQSDPTWRALFADAAARGCLVADASAERLFPAGCPAGGVRNAGGAAAAVGAGGGQLGLGGQPLLQGGQLALAAGLTGAAAAAAGGGAGPSGEATPPPAAAEEAAVGQMDWVAAERLRQEKAFKEKQAKFEQLQKQKQEAAAAKAAGAAAAGPPAAGRASEEDQQAPPAGGAQEEVMALQQQPPQMLAEVRAIMVADTAGRLAPVQVDQMQVGPNLVAFTRVLDPLVRWVVEESMALHQRMQQQQQQGPAAG